MNTKGKTNTDTDIDIDWTLDFIKKQLKERDERLAKYRAYDLVKCLLQNNTPLDLIREITNCTYDEIEEVRRKANILKYY